MPAAAPTPRPPPPPARPGPCCPARLDQGPRGPRDPSPKSLSPRRMERGRQGARLPPGRGPPEQPATVQGPPCGRAHSGPLTPRVATVVKPGGRAPRKVPLLPSGRPGQTFQQLLAEVSEALGLPRRQHDRARKRFSLTGREVRSVSDFLRGGDASVAGGPGPVTPTPHSRAPSPRPRGRLHEGASERPASGQGHVAAQTEAPPGDGGSCPTCRGDRELRHSLRRDRLALGTSQRDLGRGQRGDPERLARTRGCRRSPEADRRGQEAGRRADSRRSRPRDPAHEPRGPSRNAGRKENRDPGGREGHPQGAATAARGPRAVPPGTQEGPRAGRGGGPCREPQAGPRGEEQEAEREPRPRASGGGQGLPGAERPAHGEREPPAGAGAGGPGRPGGRRRRPAGVTSAVAVTEQYEAGRVLGDGNFAVVRECRHRGTRQAYAMKIIDKAKLKGREGMIDSEVSITQSLSHPNIVRLHEVYETEAETYLILELVRGGDLFEALVRDVKFPERSAARALSDLCRALAHVHDRSIVHRDLKPENLLVQRNEDESTTLKLADFGLAKHVVRPVFTVCGTPTYVAPEILSEKGYGLEVDMWAAGVILYILLCGFPPFRSPERDQEELFHMIQRGHFEFPAPYWDNISDAAKDLVGRLLVVDPKKRYTAHQVLQHPWIEAAGKTSPGSLPKEVSPGSEGHPRSQHERSAEQTSWSPPGAPARPPRVQEHRGQDASLGGARGKGFLT